MSTVRWRDTQTKSLDKAIELLVDVVETEDKTSSMFWDNWNVYKAFNENQIIKLNGKDIMYNVIKYSIDKIIFDSGVPVEDKTSQMEGIIIVYFNGTCVNYIVNNPSDAQKLLRTLLSYKGKKEIIKNTYTFSNDFFYWLISKVYNSENIIETNNDNLYDLQVESIKSIRGRTDDLQTTVSASGETVMNIISTLSFILESRNLKQVKVNLSYSNHEDISLKLKNDVVDVDFKSYQGYFENDDADLKTAKIYLLIYLEILPILQQEYLTDCNNGNWKRGEFIKQVGDSLQEKVQNKIKNLNNEIESEKINYQDE